MIATLAVYSILSNIPSTEMIVCVVCDIFMLFFGGLACYTGYPHNMVYLFLAFLFWVPVLHWIARMLDLAIEDSTELTLEMSTESHVRTLQKAKVFMLTGETVLIQEWTFVTYCCLLVALVSLVRGSSGL